MTYEVKPASEVPDDSKRARHHRYPFGTMNVGYAFSVPADDPAAQPSPGSPTSRVANAAGLYGRRHGMKFESRRQNDGSMRIERIA